MTLTDTSEKFLSHCRSAMSLSPHTLKAYISDLDQAHKYFGLRKEFDCVDKDHLRQYIRHLREHRQLKETTIKRHFACLKLLFKWAIQEALIKINPFDSLNERIRLPKRLPRGLDRGDQSILRKALAFNPSIDDFESIRSKTAIHLLLDTGIRVGELVDINLGDLSLTNRCLVINGKGNRQRLVYLMQEQLYKEIEQYLVLRSSVSSSSERLFISSSGKAILPPTVRVALRELAEKVGVSKHVTPHMLRHTCATQWLEAGLDIRYVQKLLGHQSISTTEIYTHVSDQGLREALLRATTSEKR
jgi:site-specific recombinase XerD